MRMIWLISFFSASSWLYMMSTFTPAKISLGSPFVFLLGAGLVSSSFSLGKVITKPFPGKIYLFAIPLIPICCSIPFPYSLGAFFMLAGLVVNIVSMGFRPLARAAAGFLLTGLLLLAQAACMPIFYVISARVHEIKALNLTAWPMVRLFGLDAQISEGIIYLPFHSGLSAFPGTLEKMGFHSIFLIFISGIILLGLFKRSLKSYLKFFGTCILYVYLRYVFLIFIMAQVDRAEIYWNPESAILSFLPLAVFLCHAFPLDAPLPDPGLKPAGPLFERKQAGAVLFFFISAFCFSGLALYDDPGIRKQGRILIDEAHSDWEWSARAFDTTWYGSRSTYNYYCMAEYMNYFYSVSRNHDKKLTKDYLSGFDILILKTPTKAFEDEEIEDIVRFVENGGGLWLVGDHTNVFGMDYYLNFIAKRFGLFFHYDSTYDLDSGKLTFYRPPELFPHPVVQNMPPFLFATSDTLSAPLTADNIIIGYGLRSRLLSYSGRGFFEQDPTQDYEFGLFLQAAGVNHGKGRVAAFTDSTCFSNFYMFMRGKPELALGYMEWLNRENRFPFMHTLFFLVFIFSFAGGIYLLRNKRSQIVVCCFFGVLCAVPVGKISFTCLTRVNYALPKAHTRYKQAIFENAHSDFTLPVDQLVDNHPRNMHTFYVWTQRLGYVPELENDLDAALQKDAMVFIIMPTRVFKDDEIKKIVGFVENGGKVILLDSPRNSKTTSNRLLENFDMKINFDALSDTILFDHNKKPICKGIKSGTVSGGKPFITTKDGLPVFSVTKRGKGKIGVMANAHIFTNQQMGGTQIIPSAEQLEFFALEYYIIGTMEKE
ncbi:MAG: hypothetical protein GY737_25595 [Desulfobacteraceae bacterium]|nr:hypothetical protein [Desulfobacteraceae bacterium]